MNKPRAKYQGRKSNKKLRLETNVCFDRAIDRAIQAIRSIEVENPEYAIKHLHRVIEYLVNLRALDNELYKRFRKKSREARGIAQKFREFKGGVVGVAEFAALTEFMSGLENVE